MRGISMSRRGWVLNREVLALPPPRRSPSAESLTSPIRSPLGSSPVRC